ncbi:MAG: TlpA family protein disulfide reductase [Saprospiraceae bacterium]|nr:TlpA family protein disulfide reductase [Saprospiraceae bacterium]
MKIINKFVLIILISLFFSCDEKKQVPTKKIEILQPNIDANELQSDFTKWWTYHSLNISLSSDFIGLNEQSDTIEKKQFLGKLATKSYIPLKLQSGAGVESYKLFKLDAKADDGIGSTMRNESLTSLKYLEMEGSALPEFEFKDLNGHSYTNENTKGKTLILKTWFVNCGACVAEFPELNELVEKYEQREDIIFVSLALDTDSKLEKFLQKKNFEYEVVPNQNDFIYNTLDLQIFPTHLIVDKNGTVRKVANKASEMIAFLENEMM